MSLSDSADYSAEEGYELSLLLGADAQSTHHNYTVDLASQERNGHIGRIRPREWIQGTCVPPRVGGSVSPARPRSDSLGREPAGRSNCAYEALVTRSSLRRMHTMLPAAGVSLVTTLWL